MVGRIQALTFRPDSEEEEEREEAASPGAGGPSCSLNVGHSDRVKTGEMTPFGTVGEYSQKDEAVSEQKTLKIAALKHVCLNKNSP